MGALNGFLYICGGSNIHGNSLDIVERYCPKTSEWEMIPSMNFKYSLANIVASKEYIYILGTDELVSVYSVRITDEGIFFKILTSVSCIYLHLRKRALQFL